MAFPKRGGGGRLSAPRLITVLVSLALVALAVGSLYAHLPRIGPFVAAHRFWMVVAGYAVLVLGIVLPNL